METESRMTEKGQKRAFQKRMLSHSVVSDSLRSHRLQPARLFCQRDSPKEGYWSELPFPSQADLPSPGTELASPALQTYSLPLSHQGSPSRNIAMFYTLIVLLVIIQMWYSCQNLSNCHLYRCVFSEMKGITQYS